jgi:2-polyprenyl-6-methoxyphenol hydroxylase-like FAD-dependent oxidoreductase
MTPPPTIFVMTASFDICIRGGGIVGHALALLLARERLRVALVTSGPRDASVSDVRAYALNARSKTLLESVRCWPAASHATAVTDMDIRGDEQGQVQFSAQALGFEALTWIVDVPALEAQLREATRFSPLIEVMDSAPEATLTVICEGRDSATRASLGISHTQTPYGQRAIAARLRCELPHGQVARQWFSEGDILALLPLSGDEGREVAMVWSLRDDRCREKMDLSPEAFTQAVQAACDEALGQMALSSERHTWPLQSAMAERWIGRRSATADLPALTWVLAGDAAHSVHPLAGQGLNLGLADAGELTEILHARDSWRALDDLRLLRRYERSRRTAVQTANAAMDSLQRLFAQGHSAVQRLRNLGMTSFDRSTWLKQWVARQAIGL